MLHLIGPDRENVCWKIVNVLNELYDAANYLLLQYNLYEGSNKQVRNKLKHDKLVQGNSLKRWS